MKKLIVLTILFTSFNLIGQNYLFDANSSGFSIGGNISSYQGTVLLAAIPSYTLNGKLTFGLGIGYESNDELDISSTAIVPSINYLVLKQGENSNPISVGLNSSFQYNTFPDFDGLTSNIFGIGASIHHEIKVSNNVKILPGATVGWRKLSLREDGTNIYNQNWIAYGLIGTVAFNKFYIEPTLLFRERNTFFVLSFGILFPR